MHLNMLFPSAPTLPQRKSAPSQKSSIHAKREDVSIVDGKNSKSNTSSYNNLKEIHSSTKEDMPPPPLPRKPQIQDPLGAVNHQQSNNSIEASPIKYQSLNTKEFDASKNYIASSTGDSSPPSSLSAESSNSEETKSISNSSKYLGAIPKRKPQSITTGQENGLQGMAKHMRRNKPSK